MIAEVQTGTCSNCSCAVERPIPPGPFADLIRRTAMTCAGCIGEEEAAEQSDADRAARRRAEHRRAARLETCGVPAGLRGVNVAQLPDGPVAADMRRWASGALLPGVLLTGEPGTGKTTSAAAALLALVSRARGRWVSAPALLLQLGAGFGDRERAAAVDSLLGAGALVLDDIDKVRPTEYGAEVLFVAIDRAITDARPLLVTTNVTLGVLADRYPGAHGPAIASRLATLTTHRMGGPDLRLG